MANQIIFIEKEHNKLNLIEGLRGKTICSDTELLQLIHIYFLNNVSLKAKYS